MISFDPLDVKMEVYEYFAQILAGKLQIFRKYLTEVCQPQPDPAIYASPLRQPQ